MAATVGAASLTGLKVFQGLDGQWKGLSFTASGEVDGLEAVVSSSEDSSLPAATTGAPVAAGADGSGTSYRRFLSGDQPGGRRLVNS